MSELVRIYGIIPARAGSKGVPKKNLALLGSHPLIAYSIAAAKMTRSIHRVIVSTDSEEIAAVARSYGAETPFLRPAELAGDLSPDRDFLVHALTWFQENEKSLPEYLVNLRPTTPLRDPGVIEDAIQVILNNAGATSLRSAHEAPESPFKWFQLDQSGYFQGLPWKGSGLRDADLPRQLFPKAYVPNGYVDVLKSAHIMTHDDVHGDRIIGYISPKCCEVDTKEDLEFLYFQVSGRRFAVVDYLKSNYSEE